MNILNIIDEIEKVDAEVYERLNPRRRAFKTMASFGSKVAVAAVPLAIASMFKRAYGQTSNDTATVVGVLQFALTLEYLEAEFYTLGAAKAGLVPAGPATGAIATIRDHENAHVAFLKSAITGLGATPGAKPNFDFTAKGNFNDVFTNYDTFLAVAQTFEDTGVRAYKGQAGSLMGAGNEPYLTAALNIHSVEARHASHIRQMRKARGAAVKPWITLNESGIGSPAVAPSYAGEELTTQAGVSIVNINGQTISASAASEAFDEPLSKAQILTIVTPFLA